MAPCPLYSFVAIALLAVAPGAVGRNAKIPPWTLELEQRLQPWCPADCKEEIPFTASYKQGDRSLVFVGAHHDFSSQSATFRAVDSGFTQISPAIVIVEGFPTAMGENPAPLVQEAHRYGTPEATEYSRGEGMYAASLALDGGAPFIGGEPTRREELQALKEHGFSERDVAFAYLVGGLSQSLRAKTLQNAADPNFPDAFRIWAQGFHDQYQLEPLSIEEFSSIYQNTFGVDVRSDPQAIERAEPGSPSLVGRLKQTEMHARDEHLWATIQKQMAMKKKVLVVYGGSHWTTLSEVLEEELGKPTISSTFSDNSRQ